METKEYWIDELARDRHFMLDGPEDYLEEPDNFLGEGSIEPFDRPSVVESYLSAVLWGRVHDEFSEEDPSEIADGELLPLDHALKAFGIGSETFLEWFKDQNVRTDMDRYAYDDFWWYLQDSMYPSALADEMAEAIEQELFCDIKSLALFFEWAARYTWQIAGALGPRDTARLLDDAGRLLPAPVPDWAVQRILKRDGDCCAKCKTSVGSPASAIGYLVHPFRGGLNDVCNLAVLCEACKQDG